MHSILERVEPSRCYRGASWMERRVAEGGRNTDGMPRTERAAAPAARRRSLRMSTAAGALIAGVLGYWLLGPLVGSREANRLQAELARVEAGAAELRERASRLGSEKSALAANLTSMRERADALEEALAAERNRRRAVEERLAVREARESELASLLRSAQRLRSFAAGERFREPLGDGTPGPEMVVIPAGSFLMGWPPSERIQYPDESPQHRVTLARPFAMGRHEVTFEEYDRFAEAVGHDKPGDQGWGRGRRPVIRVSVADAEAYAAWLSTETGGSCRLPSEAEWEYAARAGTSTTYAWGSKPGRKRANCQGCGSEWDGRQTAPVGSFAPNAWGLHDMHGNVWELVADAWHDDYEGAPADGSVWEGGAGARRVIRGGSWLDPPERLRASNRLDFAAGRAHASVGFRVACRLPGS